VQIAFATAAPYRDLDEDLPMLVDAANGRGHRADVRNWDDRSVDWNSYDTVVVRSCWDYTGRREEFLTWARSIPVLQNPSRVIAWNTDKVYLREFAAGGTPIIETHWNAKDGDDIGDHGEWVCKPSVSVGSQDTARWSTREEVYAHSAELVAAGRTSMVQPYVQSVDSEGETAMMFLDGEFSHAIRKGQLLLQGEGVRQDRDSRESITPRAPTAAQHEVAAESLASVSRILALNEPLLYARVDLVTAPGGTPLVIELELTEPSLFLDHSEDGAGRLVRALER
jgi:hypothetical protein